MFNSYPDVLSVKQLCEILNIGKNTAYRLLQSGEIKAFIIAGKYRIPKIYLIEFIEKSH